MDIEIGKKIENGKNKRNYYLIGVAVFLVLLLPVLWYLLGSSNTAVEKASVVKNKNSERTSGSSDPDPGSSAATPEAPAFIPMYKEKVFYFTRSTEVDLFQKNVIYSRNLEGGEESRIYPKDDSPPDKIVMLNLRCLSPSGEWILFSRYNGDKNATFIMRIDGSEVREIGEGLGLFFSPDGGSILLQKIVSSSFDDEEKTIQIFDLEGNVLHSWDAPLSSSPLKFSPDGKTVIILYDSDTEAAYHSVDVKTGVIVENNIKEPTGVISPDGEKLIEYTKNGGLYISDLDGSNLHIITDSKYRYGSPQWSQDGMSILVGTRKVDTPNDNEVMILKLNAERTKVVDTKVVLEKFNVYARYTW